MNAFTRLFTYPTSRNIRYSEHLFAIQGHKIWCVLIAGIVLISFLLMAPRANATEASYVVQYVGGAQQFVSADSSLFTHTGTIMPGDELKGNVRISNASASSTDIFFYTKDMLVKDASEDILSTITLSITDENAQSLYQGTLANLKTIEAIPLGSFASGKQSQLQYTLTFPNDLDNAYAQAKLGMVWVFAVEEQTQPLLNTPLAPTIQAATSTVSTGLAKTGDFLSSSFPFVIGAFVVFAALLFICKPARFMRSTSRVYRARIRDNNFDLR